MQKELPGKMIKYRYLYFMLSCLIISACSITKTVPEGDRLYMGATVEIDDEDVPKKEKKALAADLESLTRPKPNSSLFGIRFKLMMHGLRSESGKGIGSWLSRKFGEPPVLFSTVKIDYSEELIINRLENRGYFRASDSTEVKLQGEKKANLIYHATVGPQYMINSVTFNTDSSELGQAISSTESGSFLKAGDPYDLDRIKAERNRIDSHLKEQGFYFFGSDDLIVKVDSTNNDQLVDMFLEVKESIGSKARQIYTINDIYIFPDYKLNDSTTLDTSKAVKFGDFLVIDPDETFKPKVFERTMFFSTGDVYNRRDHNMSLNRLVSLGTFRFVKNRFEEVDSIGSPLLNVHYELSPYQRKSIRAEVTARSNSANFNGSEVTLSWKNRNTFRAAELLSISAYVSTDVQVSAASRSFNNIYRYGIEANLLVPRFIAPFQIKTNSAYLPRTKFTLGYDFLNRPQNYTLTSARGSVGYTWKESAEKEHQLNVLAVNYVQPAKVSAEFEALASTNPTLRHTIEKQFTAGPIYNFTFTNTAETNKKNTLYFNGNTDISGNIPGLSNLLNTQMSQYLRFEGDFRHYYKLGLKSQLASRVIAGYGHSYGNSTSLPYTKQFFIGGTNSLRGFRARTLGPGTFRDPNLATNNIIADQSGDIKLEFNTEYRPHIAGILEGAVFIDAGNIWLQNSESGTMARPGVTFGKDFVSELAVDAGIGLRFDLTFLILRTDLAFPVRKPWLPESERWVFNEIDPSDKMWRRDNLIFNLAIGYPF